MERESVLQWFEDHPDAVHADMRELVSRCERAVRRHAREDAWLAAKHYVTDRCHAWEEVAGAHASEAYVAREVCGQLAYDLKHHEPALHPGDEDHLAGGFVKAAVEREGWEFLISWIMDLARDEEHETWGEIVRYTQRRARDLIREHHLSDDCSFDHSHCYGEIASRIAGLLARDYSTHAFYR
jgi:hypothetical protein